MDTTADKMKIQGHSIVRFWYTSYLAKCCEMLRNAAKVVKVTVNGPKLPKSIWELDSFSRELNVSDAHLPRNTRIEQFLSIQFLHMSNFCTSSIRGLTSELTQTHYWGGSKQKNPRKTPHQQRAVHNEKLPKSSFFWRWY